MLRPLFLILVLTTASQALGQSYVLQEDAPQRVEPNPTKVQPTEPLPQAESQPESQTESQTKSQTTEMQAFDFPANPQQFDQLLSESAPANGLSQPSDRWQQAETNETSSLVLPDVIASLYRSYPEINQARQESRIAAGEHRSAYGAFDTKLKTASLNEPTGFYQNYRQSIGVARQTWWGGYVSAGYRIGRGTFQPWYTERQTDDAGEFKVGVSQPLIRGRAIDPQRVAVFRASLAKQAAHPQVKLAILQAALDATSVYWKWVSAGAVLEAQRRLLKLAEERGEQFEAGVKAGKFPEIDLILNQQLIAERRAKTIESEQEFRAKGLKLSLFLRDSSGQPMVPGDDWLPTSFPEITAPQLSQFETELAAAIARRPELELLRLARRDTELDFRLARNQLLPQVDFIAEASQDLGEQASSSVDDKGDFELVIGFQSEVPIQRRKARGKIQSTSAKLNQIDQKFRLAQDKVGAELRTSHNQIELTQKIVEQANISLRAAHESLERYRFAFEKGKIDLLYLNLIETKANETEIKLAEAQASWFVVLGQLQFTLGLDPLDQAFAVNNPVDAK